MNRRSLARGALVLGVLGLCVAGFFTCFEKREVAVERGVSAEARRNPYLALGRLLEGMGHRVVFQSSPALLGALPPPPATVILPTLRASIGAQRSQALLDWVEQGGHLVVVAHSVWSETLAGPEDGESEDDESADESEGAEKATPVLVHQPSTRPDPILDRFGVRQVAGTPPPPDETDKTEKAGEKAKPAPKPPSLEDILAGRLHRAVTERSVAIFPGLDYPLEIGFAADYQFRDPDGVAVWSVAGRSGVHLVELRHGRGRISALTSDEPLTNASIGMHDNAEFVVRWLRRDLGAHGPIWSGPFWIFYDEDWPSLLALAREHALPAAIAAAVLLGAWVWSTVFRFGPVRPEPLPVRRAWLEHLDAAGRFHWRQDRGDALLTQLRAEVARRMRERHPGWRQLTAEERAERVAERAGLSPAEVDHAFHGTIGGARSFTAKVGALERIRAAL